MILRLSRAYGTVSALLASITIVAAMVILGQHLIGVTRQPLPLAWPLAVLLVVAVQLPLHEILGSLERVAARAILARALRTGFALLILSAAAVANELADAQAALQVFVLLLAAVGFLAGAAGQADPWVWSLGPGMGWVGLQFVTPLGEPMASLLTDVGVMPAWALVLFSAACYSTSGRLSPAAR